MDDTELYYNQWNPVTNPPRWYHCRACNGMGFDPYRWDCEPCDGSGYRWEWFASIGWVSLKTKWFLVELFVNLKRFPVHRCGTCHRWYWEFSKWPLCPDEHCPGSFPF